MAQYNFRICECLLSFTDQTLVDSQEAFAALLEERHLVAKNLTSADSQCIRYFSVEGQSCVLWDSHLCFKALSDLDRDRAWQRIFPLGMYSIFETGILLKFPESPYALYMFIHPLWRGDIKTRHMLARDYQRHHLPLCFSCTVLQDPKEAPVLLQKDSNLPLQAFWLINFSNSRRTFWWDGWKMLSTSRYQLPLPYPLGLFHLPYDRCGGISQQTNGSRHRHSWLYCPVQGTAYFQSPYSIPPLRNPYHKMLLRQEVSSLTVLEYIKESFSAVCQRGFTTVAS